MVGISFQLNSILRVNFFITLTNFHDSFLLIAIQANITPPYFSALPYMCNFTPYQNNSYFYGALASKYPFGNSFGMNPFGSLPSTPNSINSGSDIKPFDFAPCANTAAISRNSTIVISDEESAHDSGAVKIEPTSDTFLARENMELKEQIKRLFVHVEVLQSRVLQQSNSSFEPRMSSTAYDADAEKGNDESEKENGNRR